MAGHLTTTVPCLFHTIFYFGYKPYSFALIRIFILDHIFLFTIKLKRFLYTMYSKLLRSVLFVIVVHTVHQLIRSVLFVIVVHHVHQLLRSVLFVIFVHPVHQLIRSVIFLIVVHPVHYLIRSVLFVIVVHPVYQLHDLFYL